MAAKYLTDDEVFGSATNYLSDDEVFGRAEPPPPPSGFFSGLGSAVVEGGEKTYRSARAALSTYLGLGGDVVTQAAETARIEQDSQASDLKALKQDIQQRQLLDDGSVWAGIKNVAGAVASNPQGATQLVAEQAPNSAFALGTGFAGAKAGALVGTAILPGVGTAIGGTVGFLAGLFGANTLLETGGKAIEAGQDKEFTPEERSQVIREGATKGAVITAVDAATLGASKYVLGAANRAVEQATARALSDAGVDATKAAAAIRQAQSEALAASRGAGRQATQEAVETATVEAMAKQGLLRPELVSTVQAAQKSAFDTTTTLGKRAARGGAALGLESFGEGFGEGLGEYAATGEFSPTDAVLESVAGLATSVPELYVAKRLDAPGALTSAYSARRPDAPLVPPPAPTAQADLDTAAADLQSAVDPYLGIKQATTVDDAITAAGVAAAAPVPSPTLSQQVATADPILDPQTEPTRTRGLLQQQLDVQRQLDEASGFPTAAREPGATPGQNLAQMQSAALPVALPEQDIISRFTAKRAAAIDAIGQALGVGATPRGEIDPAELEAKRASATRVALGELGLPRFQYTPELQGNKQNQPVSAAEPDLVGAYVQQMRETNTPAARAFVQLVETGSITPADVTGMLDRQSVKGLIKPAPAIPSNATPPQIDGIQIESTGARAASPALDEAVADFGSRPLTAQDLTVEGAAARIERAGRQAPQQPAPAGSVEVATGEDLAPRGAFLGRNEAIRAANLPRPGRVGGELTSALSDEQLQSTAANDALPAITRRGAQIELMARQQEQRAQNAAPAGEGVSGRLEAAAAAQAPAAVDETAARLEAAAAQGRTLAQTTAGRIITSSAKLSTPRPQVPGSQHTIKDQDTDHSYTVVDPGQLGGQGKMLAQVARVFGKKLVVFESETLQADGFVRDDDGGTVYVNSKSSVSPLAVFGHELTHLIKRDNSAAYSALESVVKRNLAPEGMAGFQAEYGAGANLEELTSDLTGNRFQEPQFWSDVFTEIAAANPEESRSIITRLAGALNKAVNAFLKAVRQPGFKADEYVKDLDAVKAAVKQAVSTYAKQQREPAMRLEAELMRAEGQVNLAAGSSAPANDSQAFPGKITASPARGTQADGPDSRTPQAAQGVTASAQNENRVAVIVGAKPGEFDWNFTRADLKPPPFVAPTQRGPRLEKVGEAVYEILRSSGFKKLAADAFGVQNLSVVPLHGSWLNKPEPSFAMFADSLTFEQADDLSKLLGFAFAQEATIVYQPTTAENPGDIPAVYLGGEKKLTREQLQAVLSSAQAEGLDYSTTADGKAVKFLHFGDDEGLKSLLEKTARIAKSAGLTDTKVFNVRSSVNEAKDYTEKPGRGAGKAVWFSDGSAGSSGLFGRTVNHVLVPYAKAVGAEGYRFAVSRFGERFGLSGDQQELIRAALIPKNGSAKATVDIASGKTKLEIKGTGRNGKPSVTDILWALQNKSAQAGLIEPGDYSDQARKVIAEALADEVVHHIETAPAGKSAIGWYDRALKSAKQKYLSIFPELGTDKNAEMMFDALLGVASQGNNVFSNSIFAARVYQLLRGEKMSISQAVAALNGTFGGETVAIENNFLKLEELLDRNGFDEMRRFFNKKDLVANINARLRSDTTLFFKGKPLQVDGAADQTVTGWMVFGPKIGSFINNLHGDYTTLTADLWFSRTWNRILGFSFVHVPALEAEQFQRFQQAIIAEYGFSRDREGPIAPKRIDKNGKVSMPEFGTDMAAVDEARVQEVLGDPDEALKFATELEDVYKKGGYKQKSDLRRAAKNWVENRRDAEAAPRTDLERSFQQDTVETAQKIIRRRTGSTITIADIQAALWYYEKDELFKKLGGTNKTSEAADYAGAAEETIKLYNEGDLYYNKTDKRYVLGTKGDYLPGYKASLSRTRELAPADIPVAKLRGRKVAMQVRVEDTGETGTLTMDAADSLTDIDERESAMQRLLECLRK